MSNPSFSLHHLTDQPRQTNPGKPPLLLLLHGIGSNERDLLGLAPYLDGRFFLVSARAPITLGLDSYGWFHAEFTPSGTVADTEEAEASRRLLLRFIPELVEAYQADPSMVYLMGFSQGAIMSLAVALTRPDQVAGIVAMSGRLLPEVLPMAAPPEALAGLPLMVVHGTEDPVLPVSNGRAIERQLSALPVELSYREYPMGHEVTIESLRDINGWLAAQLDRKLANSGHR